MIGCFGIEKQKALVERCILGSQPASKVQCVHGLSELIASDELHPGIIIAVGLDASWLLKKSSGER